MAELRRWVLVAATAMLLVGCGVPSPLAGLQRATGLASPTPALNARQETARAAMQHWFDLLNTTQRDGSTTLTTKITGQGRTDGHANTALDYALNKVAAHDATLDISWHFADPLTHTNTSGEAALEGIHFATARHLADNGSYVFVTYSYRATTDSDADNGTVAQGYIRPGGRSAIAAEDAGGVNGYQTAHPTPHPGSIHVPIAVISYAIRAVMTVPEELTVRLGTDAVVADVRSARWDPEWGSYEYPTTSGQSGGASQNRVQCSLRRDELEAEKRNVEIDYVWWTLPSRTPPPAVYANQQITLATTMPEDLNGTVVVNPDLRTGSMQASGRTINILVGEGTSTVSGRWVCPPSSVTGGAFS